VPKKENKDIKITFNSSTISFPDLNILSSSFVERKLVLVGIKAGLIFLINNYS